MIVIFILVLGRLPYFLQFTNPREAKLVFRCFDICALLQNQRLIFSTFADPFVVYADRLAFNRMN